MTFSFMTISKYHYAEVYRIGGDFYTGIRIGIEPWQFRFNLAILGIHFCLTLGKEYGA